MDDVDYKHVWNMYEWVKNVSVQLSVTKSLKKSLGWEGWSYPNNPWYKSV